MGEDLPKVVSKLTRTAQREAATRPTIGGSGTDARQQKLNEELGLDPKFAEARRKLAAGEISDEQFWKIVRGG